MIKTSPGRKLSSSSSIVLPRDPSSLQPKVQTWKPSWFTGKSPISKEQPFRWSPTQQCACLQQQHPLQTQCQQPPGVSREVVFKLSQTQLVMLNVQENSYLGSGLLHYIFTQTKLPSVTLAHSEHMATSPNWSNITNWKYQSVYFYGCQIVSDCHLLCLKFRANGASSTSVFLFFVGSPLISPLAAEDGREVEGRPLFLPWVLIQKIKHILSFIPKHTCGVTASELSTARDAEDLRGRPMVNLSPTSWPLRQWNWQFIWNIDKLTHCIHTYWPGMCAF